MAPRRTPTPSLAAIDPTLPYEEIIVNGKTLKMVFTYGALARAEDMLLARGIQVNLLFAMVRRNTLTSVRSLFAASLFAYQPELDPLETQEWVTPDNLLPILEAIENAWSKSKPEDRPLDPPAPAK